MSADYEIRGVDAKSMLKAIEALPKTYDDLSFKKASETDTTFSVSIRSILMGTVIVRRSETLLSGRGNVGPVLAWLADAFCAETGKGIVWDPQADNELEEAPTYEDVLEFVPEPTDEVELPGSEAQGPLEQAEHFLALLEEGAKIEIDGDREDLAKALAVALDTMPAQRAQAVETVFLNHPSVAELFADQEELGELLAAWG